MSSEAIHLFIPEGAVRGQQIALQGADAARVYQKGLRAGGRLVALDGSGWALDVDLIEAGPALAYGRVVGRRLATERRSKVTVYQAMLHPSDFRRLLVQATALGVVAFQPLISDGSVLPRLDEEGRPEGEAEWPLLLRDSAEAAGRGLLPLTAPPMLFDAALDHGHGAGGRLIVDPTGGSLEDALADRPFSLACYLPPPGGFTDDELSRARAHGLAVVAPLGLDRDPIRPAVETLRRIYEALEAAS